MKLVWPNAWFNSSRSPLAGAGWTVTSLADQVVQGSPHDPGGKHAVVAPAGGRGQLAGIRNTQRPRRTSGRCPIGQPHICSSGSRKYDSGCPATFVDASNPHNNVLPVRGVAQIKYESMRAIRDRLPDCCLTLRRDGAMHCAPVAQPASGAEHAGRRQYQPDEVRLSGESEPVKHLAEVPPDDSLGSVGRCGNRSHRGPARERRRPRGLATE